MDSSDALQRAIERFMIGGKDEGSHGDDYDMKEEGHDDTGHQSMFLRQEEHLIAKAEKRYKQIFKTFCSFVNGEWMGADDQLGDVLHSIANIRSRLPIEENAQSLLIEHKRRSKNWMGCGYGEHFSFSSRSMRNEDIVKALSHDMIQHEKMMSSARALLSSISDCQDALGRKLEEMMKHHLEFGILVSRSSSSCVCCIERMSEIFSVLSMELYRKQCLVHAVLDPYKDGSPVGNGTSFTGSPDFGVSTQATKRACVEWPRGSKYSFIDTAKLSQIMNSCSF